MKSNGNYRFTLSWPMETEEQIMAGEFLEKLGNRKSKVIIQLICDYLIAHPEVMDSKETIKFIVNSTPLSDKLTETIKSIIQSELVGKMLMRSSLDNSDTEQTAPIIDKSIDDMFVNLDIWNNN